MKRYFFIQLILVPITLANDLFAQENFLLGHDHDSELFMTNKNGDSIANNFYPGAFFSSNLVKSGTVIVNLNNPHLHKTFFESDSLQFTQLDFEKELHLTFSPSWENSTGIQKPTVRIKRNKFKGPVYFHQSTLPNVRISHSWFIKNTTFSNSTFKGKFELESSNFEQNIELRNCLFNDDFSVYNSSFEQRVDWSGCVFDSSIVFANVRFDSILDLSNTTIRSSISFVNSQLPKYLSLENSTIQSQLTLNNSLRSITKDRCELNLIGINMDKVKFNTDQFSIYIPPEIDNKTYDQLCNIYESTLLHLKKMGFNKKYEKLDLTYKAFQLTRDPDQGYFDILIHHINKYWNNYGYAKNRIWLHTIILFGIFLIHNWLRLPFLVSNVYSERGTLRALKRHKVLRAYKIKFKTYPRLNLFGFSLSFMYTSLIFFGIKLNVDQLNFERLRSVFVVLFQYIIGIVCLAYLANSIITDGIIGI